MREHLLHLIDRARQGTDAEGARGFPSAMDRLAADAIRLSRIAGAIHIANAPLMKSDDELSTAGVTHAEREQLVQEESAR